MSTTPDLMGVATQSKQGVAVRKTRGDEATSEVLAADATRTKAESSDPAHWLIQIGEVRFRLLALPIPECFCSAVSHSSATEALLV